jgi:hypothetical protein
VRFPERRHENLLSTQPRARLVFLIISLNIWLTGFGSAHWWLYVPGGFLLFAVLTGFCPGMVITRCGNCLYADGVSEQV